ncbi:hypothetical protein Oscil6304_4168 [Oscillatoria acuminata PCC 6304]|uniref:Uncharacterized protein n=1 Tax=Oscillatoria acuminata PCC 6304 TaxID=56110 RepID=K9TLF4_9CYAN|nr:hypothetical protein Oscil6304_4168 [Oscillatoria acuminata PCC 6304]
MGGHTESGCQRSVKTPQAKAWGYTDEACLRRLKSKTTFELRIWYLL